MNKLLPADRVSCALCCFRYSCAARVLRDRGSNDSGRGPSAGDDAVGRERFESLHAFEKAP
jgi:hypothetical protein